MVLLVTRNYPKPILQLRIVIDVESYLRALYILENTQPKRNDRTQMANNVSGWITTSVLEAISCCPDKAATGTTRHANITTA